MPASLLAALAIPLLGLLPGLLLLRRIGGLQGPVRSQDRDRADRWIETLVIATGVSVLLSGWLALILAELEVFSLGLLFLVEALIGGVLLVPVRLGEQRSTWSGASDDATGSAELGSRSVGSSPRSSWPNGRELITLGAGLVIVVSLGAVYLNPSEHVLGGQDPGVYVVTGAIIAETGGIVIHDRELAELPPAARALLFPDPPVRFAEGSRQIGLYLTDSARGRVVPHGLHYYPAAIAVMVALGGLPWGLATGGLFTLLGVAMVGLAAKEAFGRATGLLAAALLSVNVAQVWFARYPAAEPLAQVQLWLGLFALTRLLRGSDRLPVGQQRLLAALAGWSLGLLLLTKVELVVVPAVVVGFLWYLGLTGRFRPAYWWLLAPYSAVALHALLHYGLIATWYVYSALTLDRYGIALASISVLGGLIAGGSLALRTRLEPVALSLERHGARFTTGAAVAIAGAA
ncbi:MAG: hypothetical protein HY329_06795, partial [Chloroflexi bacterium]|nr:hypothetical protein [Chloroflexota bacterium]